MEIQIIDIVAFVIYILVLLFLFGFFLRIKERTIEKVYEIPIAIRIE